MRQNISETRGNAKWSHYLEFIQASSNNNNVANIRAYVGEIEPILQDLSMHNSEVFIRGYFVINILKENDDKHFAVFLDTMLAYSLYPQITLHTR